MANQIVDSGYFWFGFTVEIDKCIDKSRKYHCEKNIIKIEKKPKIIIIKDPHIRYQSDLSYQKEYLKLKEILTW